MCVCVWCVCAQKLIIITAIIRINTWAVSFVYSGPFLKLT